MNNNRYDNLDRVGMQPFSFPKRPAKLHYSYLAKYDYHIIPPEYLKHGDGSKWGAGSQQNSESCEDLDDISDSSNEEIEIQKKSSSLPRSSPSGAKSQSHYARLLTPASQTKFMPVVRTVQQAADDEDESSLNCQTAASKPTTAFVQQRTSSDSGDKGGKQLVQPEPENGEGQEQSLTLGLLSLNKERFSKGFIKPSVSKINRASEESTNSQNKSIGKDAVSEVETTPGTSLKKRSGGIQEVNPNIDDMMEDPLFSPILKVKIVSAPNKEESAIFPASPVRSPVLPHTSIASKSSQKRFIPPSLIIPSSKSSHKAKEQKSNLKPQTQISPPPKSRKNESPETHYSRNDPLFPSTAVSGSKASKKVSKNGGK